MKIIQLDWGSLSKLPSKSYVCGYCGNSLASNSGFFAKIAGTNMSYIYICGNGKLKCT